MRTQAIRMAAAAVAIVVLGGVPAHAATRTETQRYQAGTAGDATIWAPRCVEAAGGPNVGGVCFAIRPGDTHITLAMTDDIWTGRVDGELTFLTAGNSIISRHSADCRGTGPFAIPAGAAWARVSLYGPVMSGINFACGRSVEPTSGAVTATFQSSAPPGRVVSVSSAGGAHGLHWCLSKVSSRAPNVGGACFAPQPGETQVSIVAKYGVSANAPFSINWRGPNGEELGRGDYCNATGWLTMPPGTAEVLVFSSALAFQYPCGTPAPLSYPVLDSYTATFR